MPGLSNRVQTFTDSVIRRMTRISDEYGAINLSQGFPDFDPPKEIMDALAKAAYEGPHQYSITFGAENFREALARKQERAIGRTIDPDKEIVVTCGGTEAMMCAMMTICNPGDKVMVFSPFYENYGADAILSGAEPIYIPLVPPTYEFDIRLVEESKKWVLSPERKAPKQEREYAAERLDGVITKIKNAMQHALAKIQRTLMQPEVKQAGKEQVKKKAKESIMDMLAKAKINADRDNRERWEREGRIAPTKKQDMEL